MDHTCFEVVFSFFGKFGERKISAVFAVAPQDKVAVLKVDKC